MYKKITEMYHGHKSHNSQSGAPPPLAYVLLKAFAILQKDAISLVSRLDLLYCLCDLGMGLGSYSSEIRDPSQFNLFSV